ncbi:hypothetical protein [Wenjunlia tyrosinilytica]|uniref:Uncharacterized protein n=1 Tax=Wenjunlia tyrosinilytica TaxID=1544741 RepID=A0A917ZEW5_9ACTN|nr:hypothetical protein [Wenjunlia tyrosinilytica]GGO81715.1 hypothetical protein GCM10012280_06640 [Wenjunlia tyrosinilytica]
MAKNKAQARNGRSKSATPEAPEQGGNAAMETQEQPSETFSRPAQGRKGKKFGHN